jgi:hypothetical protein
MNPFEIELKPCPFCGRQATIVMHPGTNWDGKAGKYINVGANHGCWYVGCSYRWFEGLDNDPMCEVCPSASWYAHLEDAIEHWNNQIAANDLTKLQDLIQKANNFLSSGGWAASVQKAAQRFEEISFEKGGK